MVIAQCSSTASRGPRLPHAMPLFPSYPYSSTNTGFPIFLASSAMEESLRAAGVRRCGVMSCRMTCVIPRLGIVIEGHAAVVNPAQMAVWVDPGYEFAQMPPVLLLREHVELVGERPPDVPERGEPRHYVMQVGIVVPLIHAAESPLIVRMEEDDVRFNSESG